MRHLINLTVGLGVLMVWVPMGALVTVAVREGKWIAVGSLVIIGSLAHDLGEWLMERRWT